MKKYFGVIFFVCVFVAMVMGGIAYAIVSNVNDYARLTKLDYKAVVVDEKEGDNGKVLITERLTYDIHAWSRGNTYWELWRDLPEEDVDGAKVRYNVLSVKRLTTNGKDDYLEFEQAKKLYWDDSDYVDTFSGLGPNKWFHSKGPYDGEYRFECVLMYVGGLYRQTVEFEIQYEMMNASLRYADCSELYLSLYSGKDIKHLNSVKAQILIPESKMPAENNYDAYTYGTNAHQFDFVRSKDLNDGYFTFAFELDESQLKFKPYNRDIEFALIAHGEDKHRFTQYAFKNRYYNHNVYSNIQKEQAKYELLPEKFKTAKIITLSVFAGVVLFAVCIIFIADRTIKRKRKFPIPKQDFHFYKEIPSELDAVFAGALCFCKHKNSDLPPGGFAAAMLGLVQKGYVDLQKKFLPGDWTQENTYVSLNKNNFNKKTGKSLLEPVTKSEELYYALLRRHAEKTSVSLAELEEKISVDYEYTDSFNKNMKSSVKSEGVLDGYLSDINYKKVKKSCTSKIVLLIVLGSLSLIANLISRITRLDFAFGGFFLLGAGFYFAAALLKKLSQKYVLLTQFGADEYSKWRGLYKYLNSETLMKEKEVPDIAIWEDYLLYATSFGIPEKVIKALNVKMPKYNFTSSDSRVIMHPYFRTRAFTRMYIRSSRSSVRRAVFTSRTGSHGGGFGGGGYGGGGRGGGGGGGGH